MKLQSLVLLMLVGPAVSCSSATRDPDVVHAQPVALTSAATELRQNMRELWADHVVWTRAYIVAAVGNDPSATVALDRLMKNQEALGAAIAPYYGAAAGTKLTELLKDHIRIAGEVVGAAKVNDAPKLKDADLRWHRNAEDIATFLSSANPNWQRGALLNMLNEHLALTTKEATARIQQQWSTDATTFDQIFDQAMMMADALSDGVIRQFASRF
jgi:hypothetical protein